MTGFIVLYQRAKFHPQSIYLSGFIRISFLQGSDQNSPFFRGGAWEKHFYGGAYEKHFY